MGGRRGKKDSTRSKGRSLRCQGGAKRKPGFAPRKRKQSVKPRNNDPKETGKEGLSGSYVQIAILSRDDVSSKKKKNGGSSQSRHDPKRELPEKKGRGGVKGENVFLGRGKKHRFDVGSLTKTLDITRKTRKIKKTPLHAPSS